MSEPRQEESLPLQSSLLSPVEDEDWQISFKTPQASLPVQYVSGHIMHFGSHIDTISKSRIASVVNTAVVGIARLHLGKAVDRSVGGRRCADADIVLGLANRSIRV